MKPEKIISGGQTGADRAALDFAFENGIACGGWCPKGRLAEDGPIAASYPLLETESADPAERTRMNVEIADATLIFSPAAGEPSTGTDLTLQICQDSGKPHVVLAAFPNLETDAALAIAFLRSHVPRSLNVAGKRESQLPGIYAYVRAVLALAMP